MKKNEGMTLVVCDKIVTLTREEVLAADAEIVRRMSEDKPLCSSTRHYDSEGNRCNEDKGCVCAEIHVSDVLNENPKVAQLKKASITAVMRKRCKCYEDADYNYHTCKRCEKLEGWREDWIAITSALANRY